MYVYYCVRLAEGLYFIDIFKDPAFGFLYFYLLPLVGFLFH